MDKNSNAYIFIYASVMVVLVAVVLTSANLALKPLQEKNKQNEKMINLLSSIGVSADATNAAELYSEHVVKEVVINKAGDELSVYSNGKLESGDVRAFDINLKSALKTIEKTGKVALPLFIMNKDGKTYYVVPVYGKGLWAPIWGNVALESDKNTIFGVNFGHEGETPGLGAQIATPPTEGKVVFSDEFKNKKIFNEAGDFTSVKVVKGGVANQSVVKPIHGVDAISGSTLTCNGVTNMLQDCLVNYINYFKKDN
jgi:Na+-transporting NADH:ubiquinone oxidoreductase subunit C